MSAYVVADIDVTNPAAFDEYRALVAPLVAKYGGKYLVRGGAYEKVEGNWAPKRVVIIEFESLERAKEFYYSDDYNPVMDIRKRASISNVLIVEGA